MAPLLFQRVLLAVLLLLSASSASRFDPTRAVHVSWRPRAFHYKGFLSAAECDHLVALAKQGKLQKSTVVDRETGRSVMSEVRSSSGMFLHKKQDQVEERIAAWTLPPQVKPVKGDAVLFFSLHPNGTTDPDSLHGSCPVVDGEKWSATKWIHVRSFDNRRRVPSDAGCEDGDDLCRRWAAKGECAKNPSYMVGTAGSPGFCRKSCNACTTTS